MLKIHVIRILLIFFLRSPTHFFHLANLKFQECVDLHYHGVERNKPKKKRNLICRVIKHKRTNGPIRLISMQVKSFISDGSLARTTKCYEIYLAEALRTINKRNPMREMKKRRFFSIFFFSSGLGVK